MSFIPYSRQEIAPDDIDAVVAALRAEYVTQGPRVESFEAAFAQLHQVPHAVAVSNATAGLHIACLALGVGPGTRVWTSPISFVASANCARYCGADVDFVDIDPSTRNMSVAALRQKLEQGRLGGQLPHTVVPVDFGGLPCDLREMRALADEYGFRILEDASHATGATYLGRPVGSAYADISVFSFHAVKIVTTAEGGMLTAGDAALARQLRLLRSHGMVREPAELSREPEGAWIYEQQLLGFNYRLTDLQAALGESQLKRLGAMQERRRAAAAAYARLLHGLPLTLPVCPDDRVSSWHLYPVEIDPARAHRSRAQVFRHLRDGGIGVNVHYIPIHTQPYYRALGFMPGDFPAAEHYYAHAISLPLFPALTTADQERVAGALRAALGE
jgi:UDP-4-amino-4,6-dideoxy-N-acetyl-beta-L-altrosamine transaminase